MLKDYDWDFMFTYKLQKQKSTCIDSHCMQLCKHTFTLLAYSLPRPRDVLKIISFCKHFELRIHIHAHTAAIH